MNEEHLEKLLKRISDATNNLNISEQVIIGQVYAEMRNAIEELQTALDKVIDKNNETVEKKNRYEKALRFYANEENYEEWKEDSVLTEYIHNVDFDCGETARNALKYYDFEDECCLNCGNPINRDDSFCSDICKKRYKG